VSNCKINMHLSKETAFRKFMDQERYDLALVLVQTQEFPVCKSIGRVAMGDIRSPKRGFMHVIKNGTVMDRLQVVQELNKYIPSSEDAPDVPDAPVSSSAAHEAPLVEPEDDVPREREICRSPKRRKLEPKESPEKTE